jgi:hypothetical protein
MWLHADLAANPSTGLTARSRVDDASASGHTAITLVRLDNPPATRRSDPGHYEPPGASMVSHPRRGGRRLAVLSRWLSAPLARCRRIVLGAGGRNTGDRPDSPQDGRLRQAQRSGVPDGPLISAVLIMGVAKAPVMRLF